MAMLGGSLPAGEGGGGSPLADAGAQWSLPQQPELPTSDRAGLVGQPLGFTDYRQQIIDGIVSAQAEAAGWNAQRVNIPVTAVVRTSATVVTITLPALPGYDITATETITVTVPAAALANPQAAGPPAPIVGTPTFTVASVAAAVTVTPGLGDLQLTGFLPTIGTPVTARPGVGAATLTGFGPTIGLPVTARPGVGAATLTGFGPTIGLPVTARPGVGAATLTGFGPTIGTPRTVVPGVGALDLAGFVATIGLPVTFLPGVGALDLTGFAPTVATGTGTGVAPGSGALTLTGFAPTFPLIIQPGLGALDLTGFAPVIGLPVTVLPGVGAATLTGFAPVVVLPRTVLPGTGAATLTGFAAALGLPVTVRPGSGDLSLSGFEPTLVTGAGVTALPGTGVLTLTGFAPTFTTANGINPRPGSGSLTLTGFLPIIGVSPVRLFPGRGQLVVIGRRPIIRTSAPKFGSSAEHVRLLTTNPTTWSHTIEAGTKAIVVSAIHGTSADNHVLSISVGGVPLRQVVRAIDVLTEPGAAELWVLLSGIPTGLQTFTATFRTATNDDFQFVSMTVLATGALEVIGVGSLSDNQADPRLGFDPQGRNALAFAALYNGGADPAGFTVLSGTTKVQDEIFSAGAFYALVLRSTTQTSNPLGIGGTAPTDDVAFAALMLAEVQPFADVRQAIIDGLTADGDEFNGWNDEVRGTLPPSAVVRTSSTVVTVTLPAEASYNISLPETVTVTVPAVALVSPAPAAVGRPSFTIDVVIATVTVNPGLGGLTLGGLAPTVRTPSIVLPGSGQLVLDGFAPTVVATRVISVLPGLGDLVVTGLEPSVAVGSVNYFFARYFQAPYFAARHIRRGATLSRLFIDVRQAILDGIVSAQSEARGWNAERGLLTPEAVVRTDDRTVTITLDPLTDYEILLPETLTVTVPAVAVVANSPLAGLPTIIINELPVPVTVAPTPGDLLLAGYEPTITLGSAFNRIARPAILAWLLADGTEAAGWNVNRVLIPLSAVVRTSDTVVTITLPPLPAYDITVAESVTATVSAEATAEGRSYTPATPSFAILPLSTDVLVGTGELLATGYEPELRLEFTAPITVAPDVGALALDGFAPIVALSRTVFPSSGDLTLTGFAPNFPAIVLPGAAALDLVGFAPVVDPHRPTLVLAGAGDLTLAGQAPTVVTPKVARPGAGALVATGFAPTIGVAVRVLPGSGDLTLTGLAPIAQVPGFARPGLGVLTLTGFAPAIDTARPVTVAPDLGVLVLDGYAPTVALGFPKTVQPGSGSLTLAGLAAIIRTPLTVNPATGQLTVNGFAVTITGAIQGAMADPYAWFPGDDLVPGRRYEEYAEEPPAAAPKKHRHPLRIPRALRPPIIPDVPIVPPELPPPAAPTVTPPPPAPPAPAPVQAEASPVAPPEPEGAHWSAYQNIPYTRADEVEELELLLAIVRQYSG